MKKELDEQLCKDYPLIFADRHGDMKTTAMCWGFDCGDGWYNILDRLCGNIQHHIDWNTRNISDAKRYNNALSLYQKKRDDSELIKWYNYGNSEPNEACLKRVREVVFHPVRKIVPQKIQQVVATQVKEKFGTLRFYYEGGDETIRGMVNMAESMSSVMCEVCGAPGELRGEWWRYTACDEHVMNTDTNRSIQLDLF
jgi:hypothetical protein